MAPRKKVANSSRRRTSLRLKGTGAFLDLPLDILFEVLPRSEYHCLWNIERDAFRFSNSCILWIFCSCLGLTSHCANSSSTATTLPYSGARRSSPQRIPHQNARHTVASPNGRVCFMSKSVTYVSVINQHRGYHLKPLEGLPFDVGARFPERSHLVGVQCPILR